MNADGTGSQRLTTTGGNDVGSVSGDGRVIVFSSDRAGKLNVWRMDSNGDDLRQLTYGDNDKFPACSPDGKWVVYTAADEWTLWKLPLEGGSAERLTDKPWKGARISPDGKWIASIYLDPQPGAQFKIGLLPFAGGPPARLFAFPPDIQPSQMMQWTPDGRALVYVGKRHGVWSLWRQSLDGAPPVPFNDFTSTEQLISFAWSPDGKQIVLTRGAWVMDVVLISNFISG